MYFSASTSGPAKATGQRWRLIFYPCRQPIRARVRFYLAVHKPGSAVRSASGRPRAGSANLEGKGPATPPHNYLAVIKVVGIGGGGVNAVNRAIEVGLKGVEFIAINTDAVALLMSDADVKLDVGRELTRDSARAPTPTSARTPPRTTAMRSRRCSRAPTWSSSRGEGGGTGTGGAPVVANIARKLGALTIGVVTRPFSFEARRQVQAETGIEELRNQCDTLIVIPNDWLLALGDRGITMMDALQADQVLGCPGHHGSDHDSGSDQSGLRRRQERHERAGSALMGIGSARGDSRVEAAERAISSPLLEQSMDGARGVLLSIAGGSDLGLFEINDAAQLVTDAAHPDANIIRGDRRRARRRGPGHRHRGRLRRGHALVQAGGDSPQGQPAGGGAHAASPDTDHPAACADAAQGALRRRGCAGLRERSTTARAGARGRLDRQG